MRKIFGLLVILIGLSGCQVGVNEEAAYDYSIEQQRMCFCPQAGGWVRLYIRADSVADAVRISDHYHLNEWERKPYKSIKELFDTVAQLDTLDYQVIIRVDPVYNFPSYIYVNPNPVINDDTVVVISDAQWSYATKNYFAFK